MLSYIPEGSTTGSRTPGSRHGNDSKAHPHREGELIFIFTLFFSITIAIDQEV